MYVIFGLHIGNSQLYMLFALAASIAALVALTFHHRFTLLFCGFYTCLVVILVLCPVVTPYANKINLTLMPYSVYNLTHIILNALLYVPMAFVLSVKGTRRLWLLALLCVALETLQIAVVGRVFDLSDIFANIFGVAAGAFLGKITTKVGIKLWFIRPVERVRKKLILR
jgi:glycopeptide antibiotics resistance protein